MSFFDNLVTQEHRLVRDTCRRFAETEILPHASEWEEAEAFPAALYKKAGDAGVLGAGMPIEVGGGGGGAMHAVMAIEGLMCGHSTGVAVGLTTGGIALPPIIQANDPDQLTQFVRPVLRGEKIAALAITEPGTGSDVAGITTRAKHNGDHYIVNGSKTFISSGTRADFLTTLVRTGDDPHGGLTFLVIEPTMAGVSVSAPLKKTGWRASDTGELAFDEVIVPESHRIGPEGSAFITLMRNFQMERLALAAYGATTAQMALDETRRYVAERQAFGKPIARFQATRHTIADMASRVVAAHSLVYQVATQIDAGKTVVAEVSMVKNIAAETAVSVCYDAVQLHGGMGYMRETLVERLSRDARVLPIGGGTQEIMKEIIAQQLNI